jgi:hypothetical protein
LEGVGRGVGSGKARPLEDGPQRRTFAGFKSASSSCSTLAAEACARNCVSNSALGPSCATLELGAELQGLEAGQGRPLAAGSGGEGLRPSGLAARAS